MALFTWSDKYSVGVKDMDNQHKVLVDILNELYEAMQTNQSKEILGKTITKLVSYTKTHFANEERYMEKYNYPGLTEQKKSHIAFVDKITVFKNDYDAGKIAMSVSLTSFLKDWLLTHISGTDKKYGEFFNAKGLY